MCNRVQLLITGFESTIRVIDRDPVATISLPETIDDQTLFAELGDFVDTEQRNCAVALWSDDFYPRFYGKQGDAMIISCASIA